MSPVLFLVVILELSWRCYAQDPMPIVTPSDIITRAGCNVTSQCSAEDAITVVWSPTRTGTEFVNTSTRAAWTIDHGNGTMTAFLSFTGITSEDDGDYSCIIITGNRGFSVNTIRVIVNDPNPISITSLADYSLNNLTVGESVTVGCVVETCGSPNVVNFTRVDTSVVAVEESITRASDGAFNWNPTADISLVGTYRCIAQNELGNASRTFTISGTPRQPAGKRNGNGNGACNKHRLSTVFLTTLLLLPLAIIYN